MTLFHTGAPDAVRLTDAPPYRPLRLTRREAGPWGVCGAGGWNCVAGPGGAVLLATREQAEAVINANGGTDG